MHAPNDDPDPRLGHLRLLAEALRRRRRSVRIIDRDGTPVLEASHPDVPVTVARVLVDEGPDGLVFVWSYGDVIGSVGDVDAVADRVAALLRSPAERMAELPRRDLPYLRS